MKVKELIAELEKLHPDQEVYAYVEDEFMDAKKDKFGFYSVDGVEQTQATLSRNAQHKPQIDFGDGQTGQQLAIVSLIAEF